MKAADLRGEMAQQLNHLLVHKDQYTDLQNSLMDVVTHPWFQPPSPPGRWGRHISKRCAWFWDPAIINKGKEWVTSSVTTCSHLHASYPHRDNMHAHMHVYFEHTWKKKRLLSRRMSLLATSNAWTSKAVGFVVLEMLWKIPPKKKPQRVSDQSLKT